MRDDRPIYYDAACGIGADAIGMQLLTLNQHGWTVRGIVDSFNVADENNWTRIGVNSRDIIEMPGDHEIMLLPVRSEW